MGWSVAFTRKGLERTSVVQLERQGYEAICPLYSRPSKYDIRLLKEEPLFPCYIFFRLESLQSWRSINSTRGIIRVLTEKSSGDPRPLIVPDSEMPVLIKTSTDPLPAGTQVRVRNRNSSLYDLIGTVVKMDKLARVSVMMNLFCRDVVVEFTNPTELEVL